MRIFPQSCNVFMLFTAVIALAVLSSCTKEEKAELPPDIIVYSKYENPELELQPEEPSKPIKPVQVILPPSEEMRKAPTESVPDLLPKLQPAKGIKTQTLFAEEITDPDQRFDRLENAVLDLKHDFDAAKTNIDRLAEIETDLKSVLTQLEHLASGKPVPVASPQPKEKPAVTNTKQKEPDSKEPDLDQPPVINDLRIGQHEGFVRLVVDVSARVPYKAHIDNQEKFLMIDVDNAVWTGVEHHLFKQGIPLLSAYEVHPYEVGKGSRIIILLKEETELFRQEVLPPNGKKKHRVILDLKAK